VSVSIESKAVRIGAIEHKANLVDSITQFNSIIEFIREKGYIPLIHDAKQKFLNVIAGAEVHQTNNYDVSLEDKSVLFDYRLRRPIHSSSVFGEEISSPFAGDLFLSDNKNGILYLALFLRASPSTQNIGRIQNELLIGVGYIGEDNPSECLNYFIKFVEEALSLQGITCEWISSQPANPRFLELTTNDNKIFTSASDIHATDFELAKKLEDPFTRTIALIVKRSGGILATDVFKKVNVGKENVQAVISQLSEAELISKEYVIICRKSSNQTNRVKSLEDLDKIAKMGLLCSCGKSISEERVEELFVPTSKLQKMLDKSYWLTVKLVEEIMKYNISADRILLNLQEGSDEVDAFVDLDGALLMFELKDTQFSMGHAYPFGGRIGLYSPDFAIIVSTEQIEQQVKDYFIRVKPGAEIAYVDTLDQLRPELSQITSRIRSLRAVQLFSMFDPMANLDLSHILSKKMNINISKLRDYRRKRSM